MASKDVPKYDFQKLRQGILRVQQDLSDTYQEMPKTEANLPRLKEIASEINKYGEAFQNIIDHERAYYKENPGEKASDWVDSKNRPKHIDQPEPRRGYAPIKLDQLPKDLLKDAPKTAEKPISPPKKETEAAPKTGTEKGKIDPNDFVAIRHGLAKRKYELQAEHQKASANRKKEIDKELADIDKLYNANLARETKHYKENPDDIPKDWDKEANKPKNPTRKDYESWKALSPSDVPSLEFPTGPGAADYIQKTMQEIPGGKAKDKFINEQLKENYRKIRELDREIPKLDDKKEYEAAKKRELEKDRDQIRKRLEFLQKIKNEAPSEKAGETKFGELMKTFKESLTPEQQEKFKRGEKIDLNKSTDPEGLKRIRNEMVKEYGRRLTDIGNEQKWIASDPDNTHKQWQEMKPDERKDALEEVTSGRLEARRLNDAKKYYMKNKGEGVTKRWEELDPEDQKEWISKSNAAKRAEKQTAGEIPSNKYLEALLGKGAGVGGPGGDFISKYPPELYKDMIKSAKEGFKGLSDVQKMEMQELAKDPYDRIYGEGSGAQWGQLLGGKTLEGYLPPEPQGYIDQPEYSFDRQQPQQMQQPQYQQPQYPEQMPEQQPSRLSQALGLAQGAGNVAAQGARGIQGLFERGAPYAQQAGNMAMRGAQGARNLAGQGLQGAQNLAQRAMPIAQDYANRGMQTAQQARDIAMQRAQQAQQIAAQRAQQARNFASEGINRAVNSRIANLLRGRE